MGLAAFNRMRRIAAQKSAQSESQNIERQENGEKVSMDAMSFNELRAEAKRLEIPDYGKMNKDQLIEAITVAQAGDGNGTA